MMDKISEVLYKEIDPKVCSAFEASEFYYHFNLIGVDPMFYGDYENYEASQMAIRNQAIADAVREHGSDIHPNVSSAIFGISSMKQRAVVITEI